MAERTERGDGDESDYRKTDDGDGGSTLTETLLWFSAAGAVIMGLLWVVDVTGLFGLTWTVLGSTTTLIIAVVAAVGTVLLWYDERSGSNGSAV